MSARLENAMGLYLDGIRDGRAREAITAYTGDRYTQHSTGVADGKEGFVEFFERFIERNPRRDIQVIRAVEDGHHVFLHVFQSLNDGESRWVTADLFDTDDEGKLVEHWDVISPWVDEPVGSHTQIDGPTEIGDLGRTEGNKDVIRSLLAAVGPYGDGDLVPYVSQAVIQHNPRIGDGRAALEMVLAERAAAGAPVVYEDVFRVIGQGDFVVSYSRVDLSGAPTAMFDIFRLSGGLVVEHWENQEPIPPRGEWANSGKF